jgi:hypothetical protein
MAGWPADADSEPSRGFGQHDLDALSHLDCPWGWPGAASRFPSAPARGVRLEVISVVYRY